MKNKQQKNEIVFQRVIIMIFFSFFNWLKEIIENGKRRQKVEVSKQKEKYLTDRRVLC
jgi:hypothetical protein